jgi:hypothetical protein
MKHFVSFLIFCIGTLSLSAQPSDTLDVVNKEKSYENLILYISIINPLLYGKVGGAISMRSPKNDIFFYANYRYAPGVIGTKFYFGQSFYGSAKPNSNSEIVAGFDIGGQIRFRDPLLSKPYSPYLKGMKNKTNFYSGVLFEMSYNHSRLIDYQAKGSSWVYEPKVGGVIGWNFNEEKFFWDIHVSMALGLSVIRYRAEPQPDRYVEPSLDATVGLLRIDVCFLIGYKL